MVSAIETFRPHPEQGRLFRSPARFSVTAAGRRSGKTAIHKRKMFQRMLTFSEPQGRFFFAAPTNDQARKLYWEDLKRAFPAEFLLGKPRETEMSVHLCNDVVARVVGMDRPQRIEGDHIDGIVLDEYADMHPHVWSSHVRPGLSSPGRAPGFAWFLGVPDIRGPHFRDLFRSAQNPDITDWDAFHWVSADVLDPEEIAAARRDLDEQSFAQEYEASFIVATGRAYYAYDPTIHTAEPLEYNPDEELYLCFDFNVEPGVCAIVQDWSGFTDVIGEVWIPRSSNTPMVCHKILEDWGTHRGPVTLDGDATGAARKTSATRGSDWDLILDELRPTFGARLRKRVPKANPAERVRVNAVNTRLMSADGDVRMRIDPAKAPHIAQDFDEVCVVEGSAGEIDKKSAPHLTHMSDAVGYHVVRKHPIRKHKLVVSR